VRSGFARLANETVKFDGQQEQLVPGGFSSMNRVTRKLRAFSDDVRRRIEPQDRARPSA
jgi:hypothetical protein